MSVDIESQFRPSHDEHARQQFVSMLRKHAIIHMSAQLKSRYDGTVEPRLAAQGKTPKSWRDIREAMRDDPVYRFYSSTRYNAQEMCFLSVQPTIERNLDNLMATAARAADSPKSGGSLKLDSILKIPVYVSQLDVHLAPGYTHLEHVEDDISQGAVIAFGGKVFTGQYPYRRSYGSIGESVSYWVSKQYPMLTPRRILDLGTCSGKNLLPFHERFPEAELFGVDVGAPVLRFGHACAENAGVAAHYSQQNAEQMNFADGSFDIITSSFFLHEVPVAVTRRILSECKRLLSPGGVMVHMELPNEAAVSDYENFFWNWDTQNNNEPYYTHFRSQDVGALCAGAGFEPKQIFTRLIPDLGGNGTDVADACIAEELATPSHGRGGWFVFGARKG